MNGLVVIDKPAGLTSHDVVNRWRKIAKTKRTGHLGTLDPMATGVLVLLTGPATRLASFFQLDEKIYQAEIRFCFESDSYDAEGGVKATGAPPPDPAEVRSAILGFRGRNLQMPPPISAKKIGGVPAYKLARRNQPVELKPVEVEIKAIEIQQVLTEFISLQLTCSAGTYIRSIAHDLGRKLGCGAILTKLRRVRSGNFALDQASTIEELEKLAAEDRLSEAVIPAGSLLPQIPAERVSDTIEVQIRQGRQFRTSPFVVPPGAPTVRALSRSGQLVAIGELVIPNLYQPTVVFPAE